MLFLPCLKVILTSGYTGRSTDLPLVEALLLVELPLVVDVNGFLRSGAIDLEINPDPVSRSLS